MENERISRKEREYLAHREEILSAAGKVFAAKGFFPTMMSDRQGIKKGEFRSMHQSLSTFLRAIS